MNAVLGWFQERIPISGAELRELTNEPVPLHLKRWWFCLGGTPLYLFLVQVVTGLLLAFYYQAAPEAAYDSVLFITDEAAYGWFLRSLHKWAATLMVAAVILHQMRVFFTGAYRKPRELSWMIGMCLLLCTLTLGFTGYSLVYEQLSYWGATVGANIAETVPYVGGPVKSMLLGGEVYGERTLSRFYVLHAAVLPGLTMALIALHLAVIRLQGVSELEPGAQSERSHFNFFPDHFLTEIAIGLVLTVLLVTLAILLPATLGPRADPLVTPEVIKPEWFFYVAFRWLKLFSGRTAVLSMGAILAVMFVWPFIDAWIRRKRPGSEVSVVIGTLAVLVILALTVWEAAVEH